MRFKETPVQFDPTILFIPCRTQRSLHSPPSSSQNMSRSQPQHLLSSVLAASECFPNPLFHLAEQNYLLKPTTDRIFLFSKAHKTMQTAARPRLLMMNHLLSSLRRSTLKISPSSSPSLLSPVFCAPIQSTHKRLFSDSSHVSTSSTKLSSSDPTPSPPSAAENVREIPFMV